MENVLTIKRHQKQPFPDLWPKYTFESAAHMLHRNQPDTVANGAYYYAIKSDLAGPVCSVIVQPNNAILYSTNSKKKNETESFTKWFNLNTIPLRQLSQSGFVGTIVGKMGTMDGAEFFCVYYIIQGKEVFIDALMLDRLLKSREDHFNGSVVTMPSLKTAVVTIDKVAGDIQCRDVTGHVGGAVVGLPVTRIELRTGEDGTENAPPRLISSDIHLRYMGFTHVVNNAGRRAAQP